MTADLREPSTSGWAWPASLDALSAAPRHHTLLLENDRVRVLETRIPPGEIVPVHTHCWPSVLYVLSWSDFIRCDAGGTVVLDSRAIGSGGSPPFVAWSEALPPHSLENVGEVEIRVISVEIKHASPQGPGCDAAAAESPSRSSPAKSVSSESPRSEATQ